MLTQNYLQSKLNYDPLTGIFIWINPNKKQFLNKVAGHLRKDGYIDIKIDNKLYMAHRLAWLYMTGNMPKQFIDHKNHKKDDNKFDNLRECNKSENGQNRLKAQSNNKTGYLGVHFSKNMKKYISCIKKDGKSKIIGYFDNPIDAHNAYLKEKTLIHKFFYNNT